MMDDSIVERCEDKQPMATLYIVLERYSTCTSCLIGTQVLTKGLKRENWRISTACFRCHLASFSAIMYTNAPSQHTCMHPAHGRAYLKLVCTVGSVAMIDSIPEALGLILTRSSPCKKKTSQKGRGRLSTTPSHARMTLSISCKVDQK